MLTLDNLKPAPGSKKTRRRVGRGPGSGLGKTSGKGHKGQKARSGGSIKPWFEGGGFPLAQRLPKRGFTNIHREERQVVNVGSLERIEGSEVTPETLRAAGLVKSVEQPIKILANGEVSRALTVKDVRVSQGAKAKISAAGGSVAEMAAPAAKGKPAKKQKNQAE